MNLATALFSLLTLCACEQRLIQSRLDNIYKEDESQQPLGNARRHQASLEEALWTVAAQGCSGTLLGPRHLLLAAHCQAQAGDQFRSGWSVITNGPRDLSVSRVIESDARLDYALLEVQWLRPMPSQQVFPPLIAIDPAQVFVSSKPDEGDLLFTVGFPDDKSETWTVTYAEGQAKSVQGSRILFNAGVINGNSGGSLLKKDSKLLVGITTGGTRNFGEPGWNQNDKERPENWNFGTPLWEIYKVSPELQSLYPNGQRSELSGTFVPRTQLYLALESSGKGDILWVSGGHEVAQILLCPKDRSTCETTVLGTETLDFQLQRNDRRFYRRTQPLTYTGREQLNLIALDRKGEVIGKRRVQLQKRK
jgi:hypothetical protein